MAEEVTVEESQPGCLVKKQCWEDQIHMTPAEAHAAGERVGRAAEPDRPPQLEERGVVPSAKNRRRNQRRREECRRSASDDARLCKGVHEACAKQSAEKEAAPPPPSPRSPAVASSQPTTGQAAPSAAVAGERGSTTLPECVKRDSELLKKLGWRKFVLQRRTKGDFARLDGVDHPAQRLLKFYKSQGAPVCFKSEPWSAKRVDKALQQGAHRSCMEHLEFLHKEFEDMVAKAQWVVLPASEVRHLPGLRISPPGVVPQRDRRPR